MRTKGQLSRRDALQALAMVGAGAFSGAPSSGRAVPAPVGDHAIDATLQRAVDLRQVPGVVAMAATDRAVIYEGAFGPRSVGAATRMSPDTVFRIASMVKLLTSVAAMQLVEQDKLKLDEPAEKIDPELASFLVLCEPGNQTPCAAQKWPLVVSEQRRSQIIKGSGDGKPAVASRPSRDLNRPGDGSGEPPLPV